MIENIIFDLGKVLMDYKPKQFLKKIKIKNKKIKIIMQDVFLSKSWQQLDMGEVTLKEAIQQISTNSKLSNEEISDIFEYRKEIFKPIKKNVEILYRLKEKNYNLYIISNYHDDMFEFLKGKNDFFNIFDDIAISAKLKLMKPDHKIFNYILDRNKLDAKKTLFIDDTHENIIAANELGISTIHLKKFILLEKKLKQLDIL